jgi:dynein heavy chain
VRVELPPTPFKFHYVFNLRDLSRIWTGFLLTTPDNVKTTGLFVRVWRNEFTRVICDRLNSVEVGSVSSFYAGLYPAREAQFKSI